jgi:hypothetical protein
MLLYSLLLEVVNCNSLGLTSFQYFLPRKYSLRSRFYTIFSKESVKKAVSFERIDSGNAMRRTSAGYPPKNTPFSGSIETVLVVLGSNQTLLNWN